ncbi:ATP-dependent Clp protease proteolytic subunit 3, chloroplastic-like [Actinidia eriantha]|uniref:ATP-dependent Clp protease proteolytic subunit 3, chloroplastic-like n=1 Tax=Actinidia eriantha TaxID=165200 RepID=UPI002589BE3A|nr:ATP-dependent Clp protease proteolytic subunit 3, chloroplastic-like [Actinidia eriantha]
MEGGCLAFTTASARPNPTRFFNNNGKSIATCTPYCYSQSHRRSKLFSVRASNKGFSIRNQSVSNNYTAPSRMPKLEELDINNALLRQRIVFLGSQVTDELADLVISQFLFLGAEDEKKDIKLFINSPGGSVTAGLGMYDAMKACKPDVSTINMGLAASMGAFLLAAGAKGKRLCMPNARVMIHQPMGPARGTIPEMTIQLKELGYLKVRLEKILARVTGQPREQIAADTVLDNFMNAWEAKEYGLVDEVINDGKPGLVAPIVDATPPPKTKVWHLWKAEGGKEKRRNFPSEEKLLQNGNSVGSGSGEEKGLEQEKLAT